MAWDSIGEDGCELPGPGSCMERALSLAYKATEDMGTEYAVILDRESRVGVVTSYQAVTGRSRVITMVAPRRDGLPDGERDLVDLKRGDLVQVRERV